MTTTLAPKAPEGTRVVKINPRYLCCGDRVLINNEWWTVAGITTAPEGILVWSVRGETHNVGWSMIDYAETA